jgi:hypothetical protein
MMNVVASDKSNVDLMVEDMKPKLRVAIARIFNQLIRYGFRRIGSY